MSSPELDKCGYNRDRNGRVQIHLPRKAFRCARQEGTRGDDVTYAGKRKGSFFRQPMPPIPRYTSSFYTAKIINRSVDRMRAASGIRSLYREYHLQTQHVPVAEHVATELSFTIHFLAARATPL